LKPLNLSIQAFGPFSGTETIDFTSLGDNPLFLINGTTGAGKSSILDAICFALYGQTTGNEREAAQMRCDHADDSLITEIILDFSLGDKSYRIRRIPMQDRPKKSGEGSTTHQTEAQLWFLDGTDEGELLVAKKVNEATVYITDLIGLEVEQFRQVMVLPQGKFRELLIADSKKREEIFSQLFQTQIYKRIEDQLKSQASGIRQAVEKHQNKIKGMLETAEVNSEAQLLEEMEQLQPELSVALTNKEEASKQLKTANTVKDKAVELITRFDNLDKKQAELKTKQEQEPSFKLKQNTLVYALSAQKIQHVYEQQLAENITLKNISQQLEQCNADKNVATNNHATAEKTLNQAKQDHLKVDGLKKQQLELSQYQDKIKELSAATKQLKESESELATSQENLASKKSEQQALTKESAELETKAAGITKELEALADKQIALDKLSQQVSQRNELELLRKNNNQLSHKQSDSQTEYETVKGKFDTVQKHARQTELSWHKGQAALLAQELQDNEPCSVCGSKEHPNPANANGDVQLITKQEVDQARKEEDAARNNMEASAAKLEKDKVELTANSKEIKRLEEQLQDLANQTTDELDAVFKTMEKDVQVLIDKKDQLGTINNRISDIKKLMTDVDTAIATFDETVRSVNEQYVQSRTNVQQFEKQIPENYRDANVLTAELAKIEDSISTLSNALTQAEADVAQSRSEMDKSNTKHEAVTAQLEDQKQKTAQADNNWSTALASSDFNTIEVFKRALLSDDEQKTLKQAIDSYQSELDSLKAVVKQLETDLAKKSKPDLETIESTLADKNELFSNAETAWRKLEERNNSIKSVQAKLNKAHQENAELEAQYKIVGTLSDVANGQTGNKISLQRFVLSVLLDDVLIQASQRLSIMTNGRYQLLRKEDRAKGNKASGLELEVEDGYSGKTRSVATLSGGESFMAALSLALGLSDVVQAYSGGIRLDTLFIDEGFGSLDQDSLDLAIKTLIDLQSKGRTIGIISHVSELKEQMALRIDVTSSTMGSKIKTKLA